MSGFVWKPTHMTSPVDLYKHVRECIKKWQAVCYEVLLCCFYFNFLLLFLSFFFLFSYSMISIFHPRPGLPQGNPRHPCFHGKKQRKGLNDKRGWLENRGMILRLQKVPVYFECFSCVGEGGRILSVFEINFYINKNLLFFCSWNFPFPPTRGKHHRSLLTCDLWLRLESSGFFHHSSHKEL